MKPQCVSYLFTIKYLYDHGRSPRELSKLRKQLLKDFSRKLLWVNFRCTRGQLELEVFEATIVATIEIPNIGER
jgi:hypothetical protein